MQYLGGKKRIAKQLVNAMIDDGAHGVIWEPFMGGASVTEILVKCENFTRVIASDVHPALMCMYMAIKAGWQPPTFVSESDYAAARLLSDTDPLKAFVGFGCSFGGKWFGGYARGSPTRNYAVGSAKSLTRLRLPNTLLCGSYNELNVTSDVIYCDPPYVGTTRYSMPFDHCAFWSWCRKRAADGTRVYVSEYVAPDNVTCLLEVNRNLELQGSQRKRTERLFKVGQEAR